jgi:protein-disulfide isomerase
MAEKKFKLNIKPNPYIIVIAILALIVVGFAYNQWGKKIFPASVKGPGESDSGSVSDVGILEGDVQLGNDDSPVTIIEYYSYFCGYCKLFDEQTKPRLIEDYVTPGKARFIFRPFPPFELGIAVLCANDQGKFLEYHNELFDNVENIEKIDDLKQIAKDLNLNEDQFNQCFDSQKYLAKVQEMYQQGANTFKEAGVPEDQRGTPAFVVNGELLIGAQPYDVFVDIIEKKLEE